MGAVDPLENDIEGEPGGGVEVGLSSLDIDSVDFRRSHDAFTVLFPLGSKAEVSDAWLSDTCGCAATDWPLSSDSSGGLISDIDRVVQLPKLNLLEDDSGRANEVRLRSRVVEAEVGWADGDGLEGAIGADWYSSKVGRDRAFLLPEAGL